MSEELFRVAKMESFKSEDRNDAIERFRDRVKYKKPSLYGNIKPDTKENRFWMNDKLYETEHQSASISYRTTVDGYWIFYRVIEDNIKEEHNVKNNI